MSENQRSCIVWICEVLGLRYNGTDTKADAYKFISRYIDRAKEASFYNSWGLSYILNRRF